MRILFVDDDLITQRMVLKNLNKWGFETDCADNIDAAIKIIAEENIQFLITDWVMPGGDGPDLCRMVRALDLPFYTYIILVTFLEDSQSLVTGMAAGADDFVRKPIQLEELHARIRAGLRILALERKLQENNRYLTEISDQLIAAHDAINRDIKMAAIMQRSLLPNPMRFNRGIAIDWLFHPSTDLSGDTFDFFPMDDNHFGFYILDVAGHGIAAAMQSFTLNRWLTPEMGNNQKIQNSNGSLDNGWINSAQAMVSGLNKQFQTDANNILYFTMVFGIADTYSKTLDLCVAGHPYPILLQKGVPPRFIANDGNSGLPVGIIANAEYQGIQMKYQPGDRLFLYSDGVTECETPQGEMFGSEQLCQIIEQTRHLPIEATIRELDKKIHEWHGSGEFNDDISLFLLEICDDELNWLQVKN